MLPLHIEDMYDKMIRGISVQQSMQKRNITKSPRINLCVSE